MSRKMKIGLIILAIILAAGFAVYYGLSLQAQVGGKKLKIIEVPHEEAKKYIKLIYTSKHNETASEALYNIDKLDGKVDEPHIVVRYPKISEDGLVAKELELVFIDRGDKVIKSVMYINTPYLDKMNVWFSRNRKIAIVLRAEGGSGYWYAYDQKGNLLWKQEGTGTEDVIYPGFISPDGMYLVLTSFMPMEYLPGDISKEAGAQVAVFDKHLKTIASHKIDGYQRFSNAVFSSSGNYFAVVGERKLYIKADAFVFDRKGKLVSKFRINPGRIEGLSDDGYVFTQWDEIYPRYERKGEVVFDFKGEKVWSEKRGMGLLTDGKRNYYQYSSSAPQGKRIIDAVTREEILFIDKEPQSFHFADVFSPFVYSIKKPILFKLMDVKKVSQGSQVAFGRAYLLVKDDEGLLIRLEDIFPKGIEGNPLYLFDGKIWGDDCGGEEEIRGRRNCVEIKLNE